MILDRTDQNRHFNVINRACVAHARVPVLSDLQPDMFTYSGYIDQS